MTSSRPAASAVPRRDRATTRRNGGEYRTLRPVLVYVLAALLAIVAAEALRWDREASAAQPARRRAPPEVRRAPPAGNFDPTFTRPLSSSWPTAAAEGAPAPSAEAAEEQQDEPGISPEDWKAPPPVDLDSSARPAIDDVWPTKGPESGGQRVQLRGRNLHPVYVLFGRTPAQIVGVDESDGNVTLTVVTPRRTGPPQEWIIVANRDGSNAAAHFEYYR
jgi:hypothetical protein